MSALWADQSRPFGLGSPRTAAADRRRHRPPSPGAAEHGGEQVRLGRIPFVLVLMALFGLGMAGLLALNTTLQGQAFQARKLHQQANQLTYQQASLERRVDDLRSIDNLAARAFGLGMRPNPQPGFVELPSGKLVHKPQPVVGNEVPGLVKTPEKIQAEEAAKEAKKKAAEAEKQAEAARRDAEKQQKKKATQDAAAGEPNNTQPGGRG